MKPEIPSSGTVLFFHVNNNPAAFQEAIRLATTALHRATGSAAMVVAPAAPPKQLKSPSVQADSATLSQPTATPEPEAFTEETAAVDEVRQPRRAKKESPKMLTEYDFASFADWKKKYKIETNQDRALVAAAYMRDEHKVSEFGIDHMYTCFHFGDWSNPNSYRDLLNDTRRKAKWLDSASKRGLFKLVPFGENRLRELKVA